MFAGYGFPETWVTTNDDRIRSDELTERHGGAEGSRRINTASTSAFETALKKSPKQPLRLNAPHAPSRHKGSNRFAERLEEYQSHRPAPPGWRGVAAHDADAQRPEGTSKHSRHRERHP